MLKELSARLDAIINFDQPPKIDSWNPIKRYRQHEALDEWVRQRPPSAGITAAQLEKKYPEDLVTKKRVQRGMAIGGGIGAVLGGATGALMRGSKGARIGRGVIGAGVGGDLGAVTGGLAGGWKKIKENMAEMERATKVLKDEFSDGRSVPLSSLKSRTPTATSYREVTKQLKKQDVGFVKRNVIAAGTRPFVWSGDNAAFVGKGPEGLIVAPKKVNPTVFRHEAGHARDYRHYGGEQGFNKAYSKYGDIFADRSEKISDTMLPEHRAWAYAKPKNKKERALRDAALTTYKQGMGLSAKLDEAIEFGNTLLALKPVAKLPIPLKQKIKGIKPKDAIANVRASMRKYGCKSLSAKLDQLIELGSDPRPRNRLGEFAGEQEGVADPSSMAKTYGNAGSGRTYASAALGGATAGVASGAIKALFDRLRRGKKPA